MDVHQIFSTPIPLDNSSPNFDKEWELMIHREAAIAEFSEGLIRGTLTLGHIECFADNLAEHDIDPYQYLHQVSENINFVIANPRSASNSASDISSKFFVILWGFLIDEFKEQGSSLAQLAILAYACKIDFDKLLAIDFFFLYKGESAASHHFAGSWRNHVGTIKLRGFGTLDPYRKSIGERRVYFVNRLPVPGELLGLFRISLAGLRHSTAHYLAEKMP